jgi:hypothetical protein
MTYQPGDIANNHVLSGDGTTWLLLPPPPGWKPPRKPWHKRTGGRITIGALVVLFLFIVAGACTDSTNEYRGMSCTELTSEMLTMTGAYATEPYDLDKVRAINAARDSNGCWA